MSLAAFPLDSVSRKPLNTKLEQIEWGCRGTSLHCQPNRLATIEA